MMKLNRKARPRRFVTLMTLVVLASLIALFAESADQREGAGIYSEVRAYLDATSGYTVPKPGDVPLAEGKLLAAAAKIREDMAPNRQQERRLARLEALEAVRAAYADQLLAEDSIIGVGIAVPSRDSQPARDDWELLILVAQDATDRDAAFALQRSGVSNLLSDFGLRYEVAKRPILTADERPGKTRVWAGVETDNVCRAVSTMGWLVQSRQVDEVYVNGDATDQQSIGFLTVLHGTAPGNTHNWENFQTIPREIYWTDFPISCDAFGSAGQVIRLGPHAGLGNFGQVTQDIDFVSLYAERACDQAGTDNATEGIPVCDGFGGATSGYTSLAVPVDPNEIEFVDDQRAQICGGKTGEVRTGELDAVHMDFEVEVLDWGGNPLVPPATVTLKDTFRIKNDIGDPAFAQTGDSGGPVWLLDDTALGGEGAWRPLGVQAALAFNNSGTIAWSFVTPLPNNLKEFDVDVIFNNPRDPESDFCTTCNCDCRAESFGVGPREGRLFLDTALATSPSGVQQLTSLAIRHEQELSALLQARGIETYKSLFEKDLAPHLRAAFNPPDSRPKLTHREVSSTLQILSWLHDSVRSAELQAEASKWYRFVAVYGNGRDFQELVRLYFLSSASTFETKLAAR